LLGFVGALTVKKTARNKRYKKGGGLPSCFGARGWRPGFWTTWGERSSTEAQLWGGKLDKKKENLTPKNPRVDNLNLFEIARYQTVDGPSRKLFRQRHERGG